MRVDQGWCRPAAEAPDAVVGRGLLGGLEKGEAYSVRLLAARPELRWWCVGGVATCCLLRAFAPSRAYLNLAACWCTLFLGSVWSVWSCPCRSLMLAAVQANLVPPLVRLVPTVARLPAQQPTGPAAQLPPPKSCALPPCPFRSSPLHRRTCPFSLRHGSLPLTFTLHPPPPPFFSSPYPRDTHPISIRGKEDHPDN